MKNRLISILCIFLFSLQTLLPAPAPQNLIEPTIVQLDAVMQLLARREATAYAAAGGALPMPATVYDTVIQALGGGKFDTARFNIEPATGGMMLDLEEKGNAASKQTFHFTKAEMDTTLPLLQQQNQTTKTRDSSSPNDKQKKKKNDDTEDDDEPLLIKKNKPKNEIANTEIEQPINQDFNAKTEPRIPQRRAPQQPSPIYSQPSQAASLSSLTPEEQMLLNELEDLFSAPTSYGSAQQNNVTPPQQTSSNGLGRSAATMSTPQKNHTDEKTTPSACNERTHQVTQVREKIVSPEEATIDHATLLFESTISSASSNHKKSEIKKSNEKEKNVTPNNCSDETENTGEIYENWLLYRFIKTVIHFIKWVYTALIHGFI